MDWHEAMEPSVLYRTCEMIDAMVCKTGLSRELCEAAFKGWIGALRSLVSASIARNEDYRRNLEHGRAVFIVQSFVRSVDGSDRMHLLRFLSERTGIHQYSIQEVLDFLFVQLKDMRGGKAFEPVGWIEDSSEDTILVIRPWSDFLSPGGNHFIDLITG